MCFSVQACKRACVGVCVCVGGEWGWIFVVGKNILICLTALSTSPIYHGSKTSAALLHTCSVSDLSLWGPWIRLFVEALSWAFLWSPWVGLFVESMGWTFGMGFLWSPWVELLVWAFLWKPLPTFEDFIDAGTNQRSLLYLFKYTKSVARFRDLSNKNISKSNINLFSAQHWAWASIVCQLCWPALKGSL